MTDSVKEKEYPEGINLLYGRMTLFLGLLAVICSGFYLWNQQLFDQFGPKLPADKKIVAVGSSLSQYSLSDDIIDSFINLSQEGRTGLSTYKSIEEIVRNNPQVESVVVDFSVMATVAYRDYLFFIPAFAQGQFDFNYPITDYSNLRDYPLHLKYFFLSLMNNEWVPNLTYLEKKFSSRDTVDLDFPYLGVYTPKPWSRNNWNIEGWKERAEQLRWLTGESFPVSKIDLQYAGDILNLAEEQDVQILLYCAPLHPDVQGLIPEVYWQKYRAFLRQAEASKQAEVLDFMNFPLPDSAYVNFTHVNVDGAEMVSRAFRDSLMNSGVLNKSEGRALKDDAWIDKQNLNNGL